LDRIPSTPSLQKRLTPFDVTDAAKVTVLEGLIDAEEVAGRLQAMEVNLRSIGMEFTEEGAEKFEKSYDDLLSSLDNKRMALLNQGAA
jgi:hypothetical protein